MGSVGGEERSVEGEVGADQRNEEQPHTTGDLGDDGSGSGRDPVGLDG